MNLESYYATNELSAYARFVLVTPMQRRKGVLDLLTRLPFKPSWRDSAIRITMRDFSLKLRSKESNFLKILLNATTGSKWSNLCTLSPFLQESISIACLKPMDGITPHQENLLSGSNCTVYPRWERCVQNIADSGWHQIAFRLFVIKIPWRLIRVLISNKQLVQSLLQSVHV